MRRDAVSQLIKIFGPVSGVDATVRCKFGGGRCLTGLKVCQWVETSSYFALDLEELMWCPDCVGMTFKGTRFAVLWFVLYQLGWWWMIRDTRRHVARRLPELAFIVGGTFFQRDRYILLLHAPGIAQKQLKPPRKSILETSWKPTPNHYEPVTFLFFEQKSCIFHFYLTTNQDQIPPWPATQKWL